VGDVLENTKITINMRDIESGVKYARVHCLGKENFVLVVPVSWVSDAGGEPGTEHAHGHDDEEFRLTAVKVWA
jgi:hypothetical protein